MDNKLAPSFSYNHFEPETRKYVRDRTNKIRNLMQRTVEDCIELGQYFCDVKAKIGDFDQLPVLQDGRCVGSITTQQIIRLVSKGSLDDIFVEEIMDPPLPVFSDTTPIKQMRDIMRYIDAAVIVDGEKVIGIITRSDVF